MVNADLPKRVVAYILDMVILSFISNLIFIPIGGCALAFVTDVQRVNLLQLDLEKTPGAVLIICFISIFLIFASLALTYAYYIWYPAKRSNGATLGKQMLQLRVVKQDGTPVTQRDMFMREVIGKFISGSVFYLGYIWVFIDEQNRGWHDIIADTIVVEAEGSMHVNAADDDSDRVVRMK